MAKTHAAGSVFRCRSEDAFDPDRISAILHMHMNHTLVLLID